MITGRELISPSLYRLGGKHRMPCAGIYKTGGGVFIVGKQICLRMSFGVDEKEKEEDYECSRIIPYIPCSCHSDRVQKGYQYSVLLGKLKMSMVLNAFPSSMFLTLLGTMYLFALLQDNGTLELLSRKLVSLVGKQGWLIPIIVYLISYFISAVGPGAI